MKQFLRYQISGTVFLFWLLLFYFGRNSPDLIEVSKNILMKNDNIKTGLLFIAALPIGIFIHQFSVSLKNLLSYIFPCLKNFSDFPKENNLNSKSPQKDYILERISNINSYYYVRIDNGLLAPFFAWLILKILGLETNMYWLWLAFWIFLMVAIYIFILILEMNKYHELLNKGQDIANINSLTKE